MNHPVYKDIIDLHSHIFPHNIAEKAVNAIGSFYDSPAHGKGTAEDLIESGTKAGIGYFVISSAATTPEQVTSINNFITKQSATNKQFIGFGTIHPGFKDPETEITRIMSNGLKGIKLHPDFQKYNIDDSSMFTIYDFLEKNKIPVLFHIGDYRMDYSNPIRLSKILDRFPHLIAIAAHLGAYSVWKKCSKVLIERDVYIDTSSALMYIDKEQAIDIIRTHGVDKVLFGSDYPMWSHETELNRFLALGLSEEENQKILSNNMKKILNIKL
ncbi:MAG: amidohydrolase family protein [Eubacteriales bacterium]